MVKRIKELRKALNMTQNGFGKRIGLTPNTITNYETGRRVPSNQVIFSICREFNVNEEWLRNGTGEMFIPQEDKELAHVIGESLITLGHMAQQLTADDWGAITKFVKALAMKYE